MGKRSKKGGKLDEFIIRSKIGDFFGEDIGNEGGLYALMGDMDIFEATDAIDAHPCDTDNSFPLLFAGRQQNLAETEQMVEIQKVALKRSGRVVSEFDVARTILDNYNVGLYEGIPYVCVNGVHEPLTPRLTAQLVAQSLPASQKRELSARAFPGIQSWAEAELASSCQPLYRDPTVILFENIAYDFVEEKIVHPSGQLFFPVRIRSPFFPDEKPETPVFDAFLEECSGGDKQIKALICAAIGYMLSPANPENILLFAPAAGSGKSVLGNFIRTLLGTDKTSAIGLDGLGKSFELANIFGKFGNFCLDISSATLSEATVSSLKRLTGGEDTITINAKYQLPFSYRSYAKLCFACNEGGIRLRVPDSGIERRLVVIPFLYSVAPEKMDKYLPEKLWEERAGIIFHAVKALRKLHHRNYVFPHCTEGERLKKEYIGTVEDSVKEFLFGYCVLSPDEREWTRDLYASYRVFCENNAYEPITGNAFSRRLHSIPGVQLGKWQNQGIQLNGFTGIGLRH